MRKFAAFIVTGMFLLASAIFAQTQSGDGTTANTSTGGKSDSVVQEKILIDFGKLDTADVNNEIKFDKWRIHLSGLSDNPRKKLKSAWSKDFISLNEFSRFCE